MNEPVMIYVSNDYDSEISRRLVDKVGSWGSARTAGVRNLHGETLDAVPAVVLEVMRLKKTGTMPLAVADGHPVLSGRLPDEDELRGWLETKVTEPAPLVYRQDSAVDFPTDSRIHMSWFVNDLKRSTEFYEVFFGQPPTKKRDDYVKFELEEPPLNLAMSEDCKPQPGVGFVNHLGVQLKSTDQIMEFKRRFVEAGFSVDEEIETACCYAVQTKIWVGDPDGNRWELFVVTQKDAEEGCGPDCPCYSEIAPSVVGGIAESLKMQTSIQLREGPMDDKGTDFSHAIRNRYGARAAAILKEGATSCCSSSETSCCGDVPAGANVFSGGLYLADELDGVPLSAALATLGCGNPTALAELAEGEVVLDLGSGAGLDVIISARKVGPRGHAYGIDMTDEMLRLAWRNAAEAGVENVTFLKGELASLPVPDSSVDVVISNCAINLATNKAKVFSEIHRVLRPGGRLAASDMVIEGGLPEGSAVTEVLRSDAVAWGACLGGALSDVEYTQLLADAGFEDVRVEVSRRHGTEELLGSNPPEWSARVPKDELDDVMARFISAFVEGVKPAP